MKQQKIHQTNGLTCQAEDGQLDTTPCGRPAAVSVGGNYALCAPHEHLRRVRAEAQYVSELREMYKEWALEEAKGNIPLVTLLDRTTKDLAERLDSLGGYIKDAERAAYC